jgi:hypothetical protein
MSSIEKYKADLKARLTLQELTAEEKTRNAKLGRGIADIPVARMIDQVNYINEQLLPAIKKKSGEKNADYEFFKSVSDSLLFAIILCDRHDGMEKRYVQLRLFTQFLQDRIPLLEQELEKYTTLEDILCTDALNAYADGVKSRVEGLLKRKKML